LTPGLITTGRALIYPHVRERLRRIGLGYLRLQLFGIGEAHDAATRMPGAFAQAMQALRAWLAEAETSCDIDVALSTRSRSLETLAADITQLAGELSSPQVQIVIAGDSDAGQSAALHRAAAALAQWNDDFSRPLLAWEGLADVAVPAGVLA